MTRKLMKYEMRSMMRLFLPMWGALLLLSLINHFTLRAGGSNSALTVTAANTLRGSMMTLYVVVILAIVIVALIVMVRRFYMGLLRDEGYLMFTLPVSTSQLIWSKCLSAALLTSVTGLVCLLSVLILALDGSSIREMMVSLHSLEQEYGGVTGLIVRGCLLGLIACVLTAISSIMQAYCCMAIGQLSNKHKVLCSILAFVGISTLLSVLSSLFGSILLLNPAVTRALNIWFDHVILKQSALQATSSAIWTLFGIMSVSGVIGTAVFYVPTLLLLKKKLNLE